jgi:hypothetical protein
MEQVNCSQEIEAPHCLLQVAPEEAAGHIREFLKTLEGI